jgi:hypothetical protein
MGCRCFEKERYMPFIYAIMLENNLRSNIAVRDCEECPKKEWVQRGAG